MTLLTTDVFKPLSTAPAARPDDEFRVTVVTNPEAVQSFHPLVHSSPAAGAGPASVAEGCQPHVSLQRDGDRVVHIRVHCSCGQVMDLACVYDEPAGHA